MSTEPKTDRYVVTSEFVSSSTIVLLDRLATGTVHVLQAPEHASINAHKVDTPDFLPGLAVRNVDGRRYAVFGSPGTSGRAVYLIGARRPDDTYPLTRIA